MKIEQIETTVLEMPYKKPLVTATNNFTVARGLLVKVVTTAASKAMAIRISFRAPARRRRPRDM